MGIRSGTSKGNIFASEELRQYGTTKKLLPYIMGSHSMMQRDGLGSNTTFTNNIVLVTKTRKENHLRVSVYSTECEQYSYGNSFYTGNMLAAAALFALEKRMAFVKKSDEEIIIHCTNNRHNIGVSFAIDKRKLHYKPYNPINSFPKTGVIATLHCTHELEKNDWKRYSTGYININKQPISYTCINIFKTCPIVVLDEKEIADKLNFSSDTCNAILDDIRKVSCENLNVKHVVICVPKQHVWQDNKVYLDPVFSMPEDLEDTYDVFQFFSLAFLWMKKNIANNNNMSDQKSYNLVIQHDHGESMVTVTCKDSVLYMSCEITTRPLYDGETTLPGDVS